LIPLLPQGTELVVSFFQGLLGIAKKFELFQDGNLFAEVFLFLFFKDLGKPCLIGFIDVEVFVELMVQFILVGLQLFTGAAFFGGLLVFLKVLLLFLLEEGDFDEGDPGLYRIDVCLFDSGLQESDKFCAGVGVKILTGFLRNVLRHFFGELFVVVLMMLLL
jgi:hypothetical protein